MLRLKIYTQDFPSHRVTIVQKQGTELETPVFQNVWEDEQNRQRNAGFDKSSYSLYMIQVLSSFIQGYDRPILGVEFFDLNRRYLYQSKNGVGGWYLVPNIVPDGSQEPTYKHEFFENNLTTVPTWIYHGILALLRAKLDMSAFPEKMVCDCTIDVNRPNHPTYMISICVDLPETTETNSKYAFTEHLICANVKLTEVFHVLCNPSPVKDFLYDTWHNAPVTRELSVQCDTIGWGEDNVVNYETARKSKILVGSFAWNYGVTGAVFLPKPTGMIELPLDEILDAPLEGGFSFENISCT